MRHWTLPVVALWFLIAGCVAPAADPSSAPTSQPPDTSPLPSSAVPSALQSAAPGATPTPKPLLASLEPIAVIDLSPDTYAHIVVDGLEVRSKPGTTPDSVVRQPPLPAGWLVVVVDGPAEASGGSWYLLQPVVIEESALGYPFGWVAAAGADGEPSLEPAEVDCPARPSDLRDIATLNQSDEMFYEVTCFGDDPITFEARLATTSVVCGSEFPWGLDPEWMLGECSIDPRYLVDVDPDITDYELYTAWAPDVDMRGPDPSTPRDELPFVEVTGQYNHPAARTCQPALPPEQLGDDFPGNEFLVLECRREFVIASMSELEK
jgi:hypothetical protein